VTGCELPGWCVLTAGGGHGVRCLLLAVGDEPVNGQGDGQVAGSMVSASALSCDMIGSERSDQECCCCGALDPYLMVCLPAAPCYSIPSLNMSLTPPPPSWLPLPVLLAAGERPPPRGGRLLAAGALVQPPRCEGASGGGTPRR
jgi:hypothetical protein